VRIGMHKCKCNCYALKIVVLIRSDVVGVMDVKFLHGPSCGRALMCRLLRFRRIFSVLRAQCDNETSSLFWRLVLPASVMLVVPPPAVLHDPAQSSSSSLSSNADGKSSQVMPSNPYFFAVEIAHPPMMEPLMEAVS
jgi:hypothetical protein